MLLHSTVISLYVLLTSYDYGLLKRPFSGIAIQAFLMFLPTLDALMVRSHRPIALHVCHHWPHALHVFQDQNPEIQKQSTVRRVDYWTSNSFVVAALRSCSALFCSL